MTHIPSSAAAAMTAAQRCPYCEGTFTGTAAVHLEACPDYDPDQPLTLDDILERLGSQFRTGR